MSGENTIDMDGEMQEMILRGYSRARITVQEFPYVAMDRNGEWYAFPRPIQDEECMWIVGVPHRLQVNGGMIDWKDSLYCWNAEAEKEQCNDIHGWIDRVADPAFAATLTENVLAGRLESAATRTVWMAVKDGEALRLDVTIVSEPLPSPQEVPTMRAPTMEELDAFLGVSWADNCPLDL